MPLSNILNKWKTTSSAVTAVLVLAGMIWGGASVAYNHFVTDAEAGEIVFKHEEDMKVLLNKIAEQNAMILEQGKREDRREVQDLINRNKREIARLQRDLVGGKYESEDERLVIVQQIEDYSQQNLVLMQQLEPEH